LIDLVYFSLHKLFASLLKDWVSDLLGESHDVVKRDWLRTRLFHNLELVFVEDVRKLLVFFQYGVDFIFAEDFENGGSSDSEVDKAWLSHEEGAVVDYTSLEEALNHELLFLKHSVHLDDATLQEVELVCFCINLLQDVSFNFGLAFEHVYDIV